MRFKIKSSSNNLALELYILLLMSLDVANVSGSPQARHQPEEAGLTGHDLLSGWNLECPTWFTPQQVNGDYLCTCSTEHTRGIIRCPDVSRIRLQNIHQLGRDDLNVTMESGYCMTYNFSTQQTLLALCPYYKVQQDSEPFVKMPSNLSELNGFTCDFSNREGDLCHRCASSNSSTRGPSIFARGKCSKIGKSALHWLYFLMVELLQPTIFFFLVLLCKLRATTGPLNAFIFFCQMWTIVISLHQGTFVSLFDLRDSSDLDLQSVTAEMVDSFYAIWYSQYIQVWTAQFSLLVNISAIQVVALQYLSALYPLLFILLSCTMIRLHYSGCKILICLWRPFQYLQYRLGVNFDPISSIVHTFSTFLLLAYTKVLVVSFSLIAPSRIYNQTDELSYKIMSYDASIHFLSRQHLPYFALALCMLTFCGVPLLVLLLYPVQWFQRFLNKTTPPSLRLILYKFADSYMGCYRDRTSSKGGECRYFASLYFLFRIVYLSCLFFTKYSYVWLALVMVPMIISSLFAILQPYREKWLNVVDAVAFSLGAFIPLLYAYNIYIAKISMWIPNVCIALPLLYFAGYMTYNVIIKIRVCCVKCRTGVVAAANEENEDNEDEMLFQREKSSSSECTPLIEAS